MNIDRYKQFLSFLKEKTIPEGLDDKELRQFHNEAQKYYVEGLRIFIKKNENQKIRVLKEDELDSILYMMHNHETAGYFGEKATYCRIKDRFY